MGRDIQEALKTVFEQEGDDYSAEHMIKRIRDLFSFDKEEAKEIYWKWRRERMKMPLSTWYVKVKTLNLSTITLEQARKNISKINKDDLYYLYVTRRNSALQCAKIYNVHQATIMRRLEDFNIPVRKYTTKGKHIPLEDLERLYVIENKSASEIAKMYGHTVTAVQGRLRANNIYKKNKGIDAKKGEKAHATVS